MGCATGHGLVLPDEHQARSSATKSPLLAQARLLVEFVGEGRKLIQTGNLTLADARRLVSLLDTGDRVDETIGERTFKTHSASDLPQLSFIVGVTIAARLVRSIKGKLVSTKAGRCLGRDPLADLQRPVTRQSGTSIKGEHRSRRGNHRLKNAMFLSAFAALHDPDSRAFYVHGTHGSRTPGRDETVEVRKVARTDIATVDRTMRLEQQGLTLDQLERRIDDYATKLITAGRLWDEPGHP